MEKNNAVNGKMNKDNPHSSYGLVLYRILGFRCFFLWIKFVYLKDNYQKNFTFKETGKSLRIPSSRNHILINNQKLIER